MIPKSDLQKIISKYNLNGLIDSVKWVTNNKSLKIRFNAPTKEMIGEVYCNNFDLEDSEIAIYNTQQLEKLLQITTNNLNLHLSKNNKIYDKLTIEDANYTLNYSLAELRLIQDVGVINDEGDFIVKSILDADSISNIIKAKNALESKQCFFTITENFDNEQVMTIIFGDNGSHSNKVNYIVPNTTIEGNHYNFNIPFNSEMLKLILQNNRDAESAQLSLNIKGLLKLEFAAENWSSKYYLVRQS